MKTIKTLLVLCVALCLATSCKKDVDMTLVQKTVFENADIRQIELGDAWQASLVADSVTYVELTYSAYLEPSVKAKMDGSKLEIGFTGKVYPAIYSVFRATVHTSQLEILEANDAAVVQCNGSFSGQQIEISLSEAAQCNGLVFSGESCDIKLEDASLLTGFQFVGNNAKAVLEDASQFNGNIQTDAYFEVEAKDASRFVNKGGMTDKAIIKLQNASLLNMVETQVKEMLANLLGASEATVQVKDVLEGTLVEGSTLYYKGQPQMQVECDESSSIIPF